MAYLSSQIIGIVWACVLSLIMTDKWPGPRLTVGPVWLRCLPIRGWACWWSFLCNKAFHVASLRFLPVRTKCDANIYRIRERERERERDSLITGQSGVCYLLLKAVLAIPLPPHFVCQGLVIVSCSSSRREQLSSCGIMVIPTAVVFVLDCVTFTHCVIRMPPSISPSRRRSDFTPYTTSALKITSLRKCSPGDTGTSVMLHFVQDGAEKVTKTQSISWNMDWNARERTIHLAFSWSSPSMRIS